MLSDTRRIAALAALLWAAGVNAGAAQSRPAPVPSPGDSACSYARCGLGVAPSLVSLDVVRGDQRERVARLGFFWPGDIGPAFAGNDSAQVFAARAMRGRRGAAVLTDAGLALLGAAAALALHHGEVRDLSLGLAAGGVTLLGVSYPLQLRADEQLSRAVWWYNTGFAR